MMSHSLFLSEKGPAVVAQGYRVSLVCLAICVMTRSSVRFRVMAIFFDDQGPIFFLAMLGMIGPQDSGGL